jgi:FixJ family two-component response regulator
MVLLSHTGVFHGFPFQQYPSFGLCFRSAGDSRRANRTKRRRRVRESSRPCFGRGLAARRSEGLPNRSIAAQLEISEHTAKFHVGQILARLNADSRTEAVTIGIRHGLIMV